MGHANLTNISEFFLKRLYAKGKLSVKECSAALAAAGQTLHASEGEYKEEFMLAHGLEDVVEYLLNYWIDDGKGEYKSPVIEPVALTKEQSEVLAQWIVEDIANWECGEDGEGGAYGILDSIQWKYAPGWRSKYKEVEPLGNITH